MDDDADDIVGEAVYRATEAEFIAAFRARRIARAKNYDSWPSRLVFVVIGHALIALGAALPFGLAGDDAVGRWMVGAGLVWIALGTWIVDEWLYGYRRRFRKLHRESPLADLDVELTFTPDRLHTHASNADTAADWSLFARTVELRDGFLLETSPFNGVWIPKRGFAPPLDAEALATFLRSRTKGYATVDRRARPRREG